MNFNILVSSTHCLNYTLSTLQAANNTRARKDAHHHDKKGDSDSDIVTEQKANYGRRECATECARQKKISSYT